MSDRVVSLRAPPRTGDGPAVGLGLGAGLTVTSTVGSAVGSAGADSVGTAVALGRCGVAVSSARGLGVAVGAWGDGVRVGLGVGSGLGEGSAGTTAVGVGLGVGVGIPSGTVSGSGPEQARASTADSARATTHAGRISWRKTADCGNGQGFCGAWRETVRSPALLWGNMDPANHSAPTVALIDCHCHLDGFSDGEVGQIARRAATAGVGAMITAGTTIETSRRAVRLAEGNPALFAAVGLHPADLSGPVLDEEESALAELTESGRVVAMSEIGLDFLETSPDRAVQFQAFRRQIGIARELELPIIFHTREAGRETLRVLREERGFEVGGAMHYFLGDETSAREAIDLGFHVSLPRPLLRMPDLQAVAAGLPMAWIVLETDSFPQPFKKDRSRWTEPRHAADVAAELARLRDMEVSEVAAATTSNALAMLGRRGSAVARQVGAVPPESDL